ncbi:MAG: tetratricopeptide repeat-containing protein, partial [Acidobacteriota bacterium]
AELRKMTQVPELVFLNCCFIGQTGPEEPPKSPADTEYNRLAASVSRELIEMGVRGVVAAGWAVRDDAALVFAQAFYDEMLRGETFGRALQFARRRTWGQFPDANTWGAYQAYGDPDFRLLSWGGVDGSSEKVAYEELLNQIIRVQRNAQELSREHGLAEGTPSDQTSEASRQQVQVGRLSQIVQKIPAEWLKRSDVRMAIGEAYGELALYSEAIEHLEAALDTGELDSKTTMKAAEQLLNFTVRAGAKKANLVEVRRAIARLEAMQAFGPTSERFSLLGSSYKRLANLVNDTRALRTTLRKAADSYHKAHLRNVERDTFRHYAVVNWLALTTVLGTPPAEVLSLLNEAERSARESFVQNRDPGDAVFDAIAPADIAVVRALATGAFGQAGKARTAEIDRIVALYKDAFRRARATRRQQESAVAQLESLEGFFRKLAGAKKRAASTSSAAALAAIRAKL